MLTREQAAEIKRLAAKAEHMPLYDYLDSLVGEDKPVAWRVECRWADRSKAGDWRKYADYGTLQAAETSQQRFAGPGDIEVRIVPLHTAPQPPVQQRRPMTGGEIARAFSAWSIIDESPHKAYIAGILDAERHHGIGDAPCWCHKCNPTSPHMIVCPECGNKRCPHASDHALACTGSNEPGQPGSVYGRITGDEA